MKDVLEHDALWANETCLHCGGSFEAKRSTKKYCSTRCRQHHTRNTRNATESPSKAREQLEYYDRVKYSLELYYKCVPADRGAWVQSYIDNPTTKKIVCNPDLLRAVGEENIAKVCHSYVMETYGVSIKDYYH